MRPTLLDEVGFGQTAQYISHASIVHDFKLALRYGQWSSYAYVAKELDSCEKRGKIAVKSSYRCIWFLDDQAGTMAIDIAGTRLALKLKPNRDGIAVWRLVE
tara:strand:+ start:517 stop:822 length:306 start_codon:yes stop_codon:yes gene_type:complete